MLTSTFSSLFGLDCVGQTPLNRRAESLQDAEHLRRSQRGFQDWYDCVTERFIEHRGLTCHQV